MRDANKSKSKKISKKNILSLFNSEMLNKDKKNSRKNLGAIDLKNFQSILYNNTSTNNKSSDPIYSSVAYKTDSTNLNTTNYDNHSKMVNFKLDNNPTLTNPNRYILKIGTQTVRKNSKNMVDKETDLPDIMTHRNHPKSQALDFFSQIGINYMNNLNDTNQQSKTSRRKSTKKLSLGYHSNRRKSSDNSENIKKKSKIMVGGGGISNLHLFERKPTKINANVPALSNNLDLNSILTILKSKKGLKLDNKATSTKKSSANLLNKPEDKLQFPLKFSDSNLKSFIEEDRSTANLNREAEKESTVLREQSLFNNMITSRESYAKNDSSNKISKVHRANKISLTISPTYDYIPKKSEDKIKYAETKPNNKLNVVNNIKKVESILGMKGKNIKQIPEDKIQAMIKNMQKAKETNSKDQSHTKERSPVMDPYFTQKSIGSYIPGDLASNTQAAILKSDMTTDSLKNRKIFFSSNFDSKLNVDTNLVKFTKLSEPVESLVFSQDYTIISKKSSVAAEMKDDFENKSSSSDAESIEKQKDKIRKKISMSFKNLKAVQMEPMTPKSILNSSSNFSLSNIIDNNSKIISEVKPQVEKSTFARMISAIDDSTNQPSSLPITSHIKDKETLDSEAKVRIENSKPILNLIHKATSFNKNGAERSKHENNAFIKKNTFFPNFQTSDISSTKPQADSNKKRKSKFLIKEIINRSPKKSKHSSKIEQPTSSKDTGDLKKMTTQKFKQMIVLKKILQPKLTEMNESDDSSKTSKEYNTDDMDAELEKFIKKKQNEIQYYYTDKCEFNEDVGINMLGMTRSILSTVVDNIALENNIEELFTKEEVLMQNNPVKKFKDYFKLRRKKPQKKNSINNLKIINCIRDNFHILPPQAFQRTHSLKHEEEEEVSTSTFHRVYIKDPLKSKDILLEKSTNYVKELIKKNGKGLYKKSISNILNIFKYGIGKIYHEIIDAETFKPEKFLNFKIQSKLSITESIKRNLLSTYLDIYNQVRNNLTSEDLYAGYSTLFDNFSLEEEKKLYTRSLIKRTVSPDKFILYNRNQVKNQATKNYINGLIMRDQAGDRDLNDFLGNNSEIYHLNNIERSETVSNAVKPKNFSSKRLSTMQINLVQSHSAIITTSPSKAKDFKSKHTQLSKTVAEMDDGQETDEEPNDEPKQAVRKDLIKLASYKNSSK